MRRAGGPPRGSTSATTRFAAAVVAVALVSLLIATVVGLTTGRDLGREIYEERIVVMRTSGAADVAFQMASLQRTAGGLAASSAAVDALDGFSTGFDELRSEVTGTLDEETEALVAAYQEEFVDPLVAAGRTLTVSDLTSSDPGAVLLQYRYAVDLGAYDDPVALVDAGDGSGWSEVHRTYHPVYRDVVERGNLVDLYLIEPRRGRIVYSVRKRPDLGTSLATGPFSGSLLASVVRQVNGDPEAGVVTSDLDFYEPARLQPVGVVAAPVLDGDRFVGVLALMYGAGPITSAVNSGDVGFAGDEEGGAFLVGADGTLRTDPQAFLDDRTAYLDRAEEAGSVTASERARIEANGTTVLTLRAVDATVRAGLDDERAVERRQTIRGHEALSSAATIDIAGPTWVIAAESGVEAAEADVDRFQDVLVVGTAIFVVGLAFLAVAWAGWVFAPVRAMSDGLADPHPERVRIDVPTRSPIEFADLASDFTAISSALVGARDDLEAARAEQRVVARRLVPASVIERPVPAGARGIEDLPETAIVVVVFDGVSDGQGGGELVDDLVTGLDLAAERHGLERIKLVGDAYVAACGHERPVLDHVPRATAFAFDVLDEVAELSQVTASDVSVRIGIHLGPVLAGMVGEGRHVFDIWGATVDVAHRLARQSPPDTVLVTEEVRSRVPVGHSVTGAGDRDGIAVWSVSRAQGRAT